jgi:hypothetical protein
MRQKNERFLDWRCQEQYAEESTSGRGSNKSEEKTAHSRASCFALTGFIHKIRDQILLTELGEKLL